MSDTERGNGHNYKKRRRIDMNERFLFRGKSDGQWYFGCLVECSQTGHHMIIGDFDIEVITAKNRMGDKVTYKTYKLKGDKILPQGINNF